MRNLGTSSLVVAAFVGPGTVLTCAAAGVGFSYSLGWVLIFATAAVFVLQTFTAGTGILAQKGLGEAIREVSSERWFRLPLIALVVVGLWIGTAAFETGNLIGASAGMNILIGGDLDSRWWTLVVALVAAAILARDLRLVRNLLTGLVALMGIFFIGAAAMAPVDWGLAFRGLVIPTIPSGSLITVVALVGTTVVTYNLFLHAAAAKRLWYGTPKEESWKNELKGMLVFLPLGGVISLAILFVGASASVPGSGQGTSVEQIDEFVRLFEPVTGGGAKYLFGLGLLAAGLTSAVTAPLAVAAGMSELFDWSGETHTVRYRMLWASVLLTGVLFSLAGFSPLDIIIAAQAANGVLLPLMAGILVYVTLKQEEFSLPGYYVTAGIAVVFFCLLLGLKTLNWVWSQSGF